MNKQKLNRARVSRYVSIWRIIFYEYLNWTNEQFDDWFVQSNWQIAMQNPAHMIWHRDPIYWAALHIAADRRPDLNGIPLVEYQQQLESELKERYDRPERCGV